MNAPAAADARARGHELVITRLFDAPRELVWKVWTDPRHAVNWWGPRDYPMVQVEIDPRVGSAWRGCLRSTTDGSELWQGGIMREIDPPRRLVFTFAWDDKDALGPETVVTLTFSEENGKTRMRMHQAPFHSLENRDGHVYGWTSTFDRLEDYLALVKDGPA